MLLTISVGPIISKSTGPMVGRPVVVDQSEISFFDPSGDVAVAILLVLSSQLIFGDIR